MKKIVVLSGAGISAESGIKTFRDSDGLWEGYDVMEVATPQGWEKNSSLVLEFYNQRRRQLQQTLPNDAHKILAELEADFVVSIITQNVDNLHEKAGSTTVLHLHGELLKVRSTKETSYILEWNSDLNLGDNDLEGNQLRPHIVWFGEAVPELENAVSIVQEADYLIVIGTSLQVYPAASLLYYAPKDCTVYYIDPNPVPIDNAVNEIVVLPMTAVNGMRKFKQIVLTY